MEDILGKQDTLELNEEEVHQLLKVLKHGLDGLLGDSVVAAGAESTGDSTLENDMASNLNEGSRCKPGVSALPPRQVTRPTHLPKTCKGT